MAAGSPTVDSQAWLPSKQHGDDSGKCFVDEEGAFSRMTTEEPDPLSPALGGFAEEEEKIDDFEEPGDDGSSDGGSGLGSATGVDDKDLDEVRRELRDKLFSGLLHQPMHSDSLGELLQDINQQARDHGLSVLRQPMPEAKLSRPRPEKDYFARESFDFGQAMQVLDGGAFDQVLGKILGTGSPQGSTILQRRGVSCGRLGTSGVVS